MPPQLKTLIPLFALFILGFLVLRYFLVPDSFGKEGHYRFDAVKENAMQEMKYAGRSLCFDCHDDKVNEMETDLHSGLSCETCHGPGLAHTENPDSVRMIIPGSRKDCGICHDYNPSRNVNTIIQVDLNDHNVDKNCIDCHNPHLPWELNEENFPEETF